MENDVSKGIKKIYPGKFLFHLDSKNIYYLTFEILDLVNMEIILIKLKQKETYVYKTAIPFKNFGTNDTSIYDTFKNINFFIYSFDFSLIDNFTKIILLFKNQAKIDLFLYNKNMEENNEKMRKKLEMKNNMDKMQNRMNELYNIISLQKKKIFELKKKEEAQIKLINKVEDVTKKIAQEYEAKFKNNNSNSNNINNNNNNNNYPPQNNMNNMNNNNEMKKKYFMSTNPEYFNNNNNINNINNNNNNNDLNNNKKFNKFKTVNLNFNVEYKPYLPGNANIDNLLTRPQHMNPVPQNNFKQKTKSINLDLIQDLNNNKKYY